MRSTPLVRIGDGCPKSEPLENFEADLFRDPLSLSAMMEDGHGRHGVR